MCVRVCVCVHTQCSVRVNRYVCICVPACDMHCTLFYKFCVYVFMKKII